MIATDISGTGWTCTLGAISSCTRSDPLATGASYPPITLTVRVATNAPSSVYNSPQVALAGTSSYSTVSETISILGPPMTLSPSSLVFPAQVMGTTSAAQQVSLGNPGPLTVILTSFAVTGDFAQTNNCGSSLAMGASCTINVNFTPTASRPRKGSVIVSDNTAVSPHTIIVTGVGSAVSLSPGSLDFSGQTVAGVGLPQIVTLTNRGATPVRIWQIAVMGPNAADFPKTTTCGASLSPGANCSISVTFIAASAEIRTASLMISDDSGNSPQSVTLTGVGIAPMVAVASSSKTNAAATSNVNSASGVRFTGTPSRRLPTRSRVAGAVFALSTSEVDFGGQAVGKIAASHVVVLTNAAEDLQEITRIEIIGPDRGDFKQSNDCGTSLAAGARCEIKLLFTPQARGLREASVRIFDDAEGRPLSIRVKGVGIE